jgi:hypothetical protein
MASGSLRSMTGNGRNFDGTYESDEDAEFDELLGITRGPKRTQGKAKMSKNAEGLTRSQKTMEETGRRMSMMSKRIFGDLDDLTEEAELRAAFGMSPTPKRTRREFSPSGSHETSANVPGISVPRDSVSSNAPVASALFEQNFQSAATSSKQTPESPSLQPASLSIPNAAPNSFQRHSERSDEDTPDQQIGENVGSHLESSSLTRPLTQSRIASITVPAYTQDAQQVESSSNPRMYSPQVAGRKNEPGAHQQDEVNLSLASGNTSQQANMQPRRSTRRGMKHGPQELTAFRPFKEKLPPGLTLEVICHDYPNHLNGQHLRRFIDEGWTARKIWAAMQDSAKGSASSTRPWNKLEHRLLKEKKRMAQEQEKGQPAENVAPSTTLYSNSALSALTLHTGMEAETYAPDSVKARIGTYQNLFRAELEKQRSILSLLLSTDDCGWHAKSQQEKGRRIDEEWIRRAKRLERAFAIDQDVDADDLEIEQASVSGMLRRFNILLKRSLSATSSTEDRPAAFQGQLEALQEWTVQWREQLRGRTQLTGDRAKGQASNFWFPITGQSTEFRSPEPQAAPSIVRSQTQNLFSTPNEINSRTRSHYAQHQATAPRGYAVAQTDLSAVPWNQYQLRRYAADRLRHSDPNLRRPQYVAQESVSIRAGNVPASQDSRRNFSGQNPTAAMGSHPGASEPEREFSFQQFLESEDAPLTQWYGEELQDDE